jgi:hypothetical protein
VRLLQTLTEEEEEVILKEKFMCDNVMLSFFDLPRYE